MTGQLAVQACPTGILGIAVIRATKQLNGAARQQAAARLFASALRPRTAAARIDNESA